MALAVQNGELIVKSGSLGTGTECCCGPPPPPPPPPCIGACCVNGVCSQETQEDCADLGGTWFGCDTECSGSLCTEKEDCVDDCCPEVPDEISVAVTIDPIETCYIASIQPFSTIFIDAVSEEFAVSEQITLPLVSNDPCPVYFFSGTIGRTRLEIQVNLLVNDDGICVWQISTFQVWQCSEADTDGSYQSTCGTSNKYGISNNEAVLFDELGVASCVGGTIISNPFSVGFDSNTGCNPALGRSCNAAASSCSETEVTVSVTISV